MPRVYCSVHPEDLEGDYTDRDGNLIPVEGVVVTCSRCEHHVESFGTGEASIRRCLYLLREECPREERNVYVVEEGES